ncbi:MAG: peptidoglycan editing factor PgeF [Oscillospiraceae bacterium]|nr:peptidoglycan editing factor PgeF [Oscillospiraceae bacterium]
MFYECKKGCLVYMCSSIIKVPHAFSTRFGGVSKGIYESLNFASRREDAPENVKENYRRFLSVVDAGENDAVVTLQVHKTEVRYATEEDRHIPASTVPYECDGLYTDRKNLPLMCFTADCVPVLLCDDAAGVIAAVHCGWRSSVGDILGVAAGKMISTGAAAENIKAAIGPSIGACCFETDDDVPEAVCKYLGGDTDGLFARKENGKTLVDLRAANRRRLLQLGFSEENIDVSDECTMCLHDKYWSHRYTKGQRGSQGAVICLR